MMESKLTGLESTDWFWLNLSFILNINFLNIKVDESIIPGNISFYHFCFNYYLIKVNL